MGDINWGVRNDYSNNDIERLRGHENDSTNNVMNDVRKAAVKDAGADVTIKGDDKSTKQLREEDRAKLMEEMGIKHATTDGLVDVGFELAGEAIQAPIGLAKAAYETVKANGHAMLMGDALAKAIQSDNMHRAMLSQLNLPEAFKQEAMRPFVEQETEGSKSGATQMTEKLHSDPTWHAKAAILQLHCDQGMNAARMMCDGSPNRSTFIAGHPDVAKKLSEDPAFKAGFDSVVWAHNEGPETYRGVCKDLEARDARYDAHHVAWRA